MLYFIASPIRANRIVLPDKMNVNARIPNIKGKNNSLAIYRSKMVIKRNFLQGNIS